MIHRTKDTSNSVEEEDVVPPRFPLGHSINFYKTEDSKGIELVDQCDKSTLRPWRKLTLGCLNVRQIYYSTHARVRFLGGFIKIFTCLFIALSILQLHAFIFEHQGPLDHVVDSTVRKPYFALFCPKFSSEDGTRSDYDNERLFNESIKVDGVWDCNVVLGGNGSLSTFPQIFMIGARDRDDDTFSRWMQTIQKFNTPENIETRGTTQLQRIDTLKISNQYAISGGAIRQQTENLSLNSSHSQSMMNSTSLSSPRGNMSFLCRSLKWEQRLFSVYQSVFEKILSTYSEHQDFVMVEDDAILNNPLAFGEEICNARQSQLGFYSLYRSPAQLSRQGSVSCIYQHGTVAFYIRRFVMELIVKEKRREWFCRFPIDMYINKMGPWYATRREIVSHSDLGRIGSSGHVRRV